MPLSNDAHLRNSFLCSEDKLLHCAMAADQILSSSYYKYSDERQLIDEDEEDMWLEDSDNDFESAEISLKHVHFVTDASLSSWKDQDAAAYHSSTSLG